MFHVNYIITLQAKQDIQHGTVIIKEPAYSYASSRDCKEVNCHFCLSVLPGDQIGYDMERNYVEMQSIFCYSNDLAVKNVQT